MNDQSEVMPCPNPWCPSHTTETGNLTPWVQNLEGEFTVKCGGCCVNLQTWCGTEQEAVSEWNTRPAPAVTVKPLEFWGSDTGDLCCDTVFGRYQIQKGGAMWCCMCAMGTRKAPVDNSTPTYHRAEASAISHANDHYRDLVLSQLDLSPQPSPQVTPEQAAQVLPKNCEVMGVGRDHECRSAVIVHFNRCMSDDDLRTFHDALRPIAGCDA